MTEDQTPPAGQGGDGQLLTDPHPREAAAPKPSTVPRVNGAGMPASAEGSAEAPAGPGAANGATHANGTSNGVVASPVEAAKSVVQAPQSDQKPSSAPGAPPARTSGARPLSRRLGGFLIACLLVVGAVGLTLAVQEQRTRDAHSLIAAEQGRLSRIQTVLTAEDAVTKATTTASGGRISAVFSAEHIGAVVTYSNLPPLPAKRTYEIFRVRDDKTKPMRILAAGELSGTALVLGVGNGDALIFTIEPEGGSGQPTGEIEVSLRLS